MSVKFGFNLPPMKIDSVGVPEAGRRTSKISVKNPQNDADEVADAMAYGTSLFVDWDEGPRFSSFH